MTFLSLDDRIRGGTPAIALASLSQLPSPPAVVIVPNPASSEETYEDEDAWDTPRIGMGADETQNITTGSIAADSNANARHPSRPGAWQHDAAVHEPEGDAERDAQVEAREPRGPSCPSARSRR